MSGTPKIKICGITAPAALDAAIEAHADHVGLMFYAPSPRNIAPAQAADLILFDAKTPKGTLQIGRASCRERVCMLV